MAAKKELNHDEVVDALRETQCDLKETAKLLRVKEVYLYGQILGDDQLKLKYRAVVLYYARGNIAVAANRLGISREHFSRIVSKSDLLSDAKISGMELRLDIAEGKLDKNVDAGREASIFFLLKTLGKPRGYIERQETEDVGAIKSANLPGARERLSGKLVGLAAKTKRRIPKKS